MDDEYRMEVMRRAVHWDDDGWFTTGARVRDLSDVPEKLRDLLRAVEAAITVGKYAAAMDDPAAHAAAITYWKRSAVEEIDHHASMLADSEYRTYCQEAMA